MKEYSYRDMMRMQEDAVKRVREMQRRARLTAQEAQDDLRGESEPSPVKQTASAAPPPVDAARPRAIHMPVELSGKAPELSAAKKATTTATTAATASSPPEQRNALSSLFAGDGLSGDDRDKALILSLCFLLYAEKADEGLLLALLYVLS